jgi:hypothetical protein
VAGGVLVAIKAEVEVEVLVLVLVSAADLRLILCLSGDRGLMWGTGDTTAAGSSGWASVSIEVSGSGVDICGGWMGVSVFASISLEEDTGVDICVCV